MDAIRVNENTRVNQASSRTQLVRSDSNLIDFFIGDNAMDNKEKKEANLKAVHRYRKTEKYKIALRHYRQKSEKHKVSNKRYQKTEKGKATLRRYYQSEKGKATLRRYYQSEKGKVASRKFSLLYNIRYPERRKAGNAVNSAIRAGKLPCPNSLQCYYCPNPAQEYHHPNYAKKHRLDVLPICKKCHIKLRFKMVI
ncbi:hypothetical protein LCGC14_2892500 [marine sediment metagenome]|uniref:Uncharacterized protein n=1 Tax=marine sediment metagenome TaxID=412755 RepID=A0A0F8YIK2_9ZZZZ